MDTLELLQKYYSKNEKTYKILLTHSLLVTKKAIKMAKLHPELNINLTFVEEAAMLHDIGIFLCAANDLGCFGSYPYICHGYLGANILQKEGLPLHALVCERHTGTGLRVTDIEKQNLPIPHRNMIPISIEEQLICFADKFFSKTNPTKEKSIEQVKQSLTKFGTYSISQIEKWEKLFL